MAMADGGMRRHGASLDGERLGVMFSMRKRLENLSQAWGFCTLLFSLFSKNKGNRYNNAIKVLPPVSQLLAI